MKIYACLIGDWVCLNDDPNCTIGIKGQSPELWYAEGTDIWAPNLRNKDEANRYSHLDNVQILYNGVTYRINPIFIQLVGF